MRFMLKSSGIVGGAVLEQPSAKLDREIFGDCPSAKIGPLENFPLYGTVGWYYIEELKHKLTRAVGKPASLCVYKRK